MSCEILWKSMVCVCCPVLAQGWVESSQYVHTHTTRSHMYSAVVPLSSSSSSLSLSVFVFGVRYFILAVYPSSSLFFSSFPPDLLSFSCWKEDKLSPLSFFFFLRFCMFQSLEAHYSYVWYVRTNTHVTYICTWADTIITRAREDELCTPRARFVPSPFFFNLRLLLKNCLRLNHFDFVLHQKELPLLLSGRVCLIEPVERTMSRDSLVRTHNHLIIYHFRCCVHHADF